MPESPYVVESFGGLDVISDPALVGANGSVDQLNIDLDVRGSVRTRNGYSNLTTSAAANPYQALFFASRGQVVLGVRLGTSALTIEAISSIGGVLTSTTGSGNTNPAQTTFASVGSPAAATTYIANSALANVKTWDGSAFANAAFTGGGVTPGVGDLLASWGGRLVAINPTGLAGGGQIRFSNFNAATVFSTNDFVYADPGDGMATLAALTFADYLCVLRRTKMFVFTGVSTDPQGNPIFNYRRVTLGDIGAPLAWVSTPAGIWILTEIGLYRWAGGADIELVSEMPGGMFVTLFETQSPNSPNSYSSLPATAFGHRLFFGCRTVGNASMNRTLVFDIPTGQWMLWDVAAQALAVEEGIATVRPGTSQIIVGLPSGHVGEFDSVATTDAGVAIAWSYTSGGYDISGNHRVAIVQESSAAGSGTVTLAVANDFGTVDTGSALTLGTSPAAAETWQLIDREGTYWQHKLSGTGPARVNRITHYVGSIKPAGIQ